MGASRARTPLVVLAIVGAAAAAFGGLRQWRKRQNQLAAKNEKRRAPVVVVEKLGIGVEYEGVSAGLEEVLEPQGLQDVQRDNVGSQDGKVEDNVDSSVPLKLPRRKVVKRRKVQKTGTPKAGGVKQGGKAGGATPSAVAEVAPTGCSQQVPAAVSGAVGESGKMPKRELFAARAEDSLEDSKSRVPAREGKTVRKTNLVGETVIDEPVKQSSSLKETVRSETAEEEAFKGGSAGEEALTKSSPSPFLGMKRGFLSANKKTGVTSRHPSTAAKTNASGKKPEAGVATAPTRTETKLPENVQLLQETASSEGGIDDAAAVPALEVEVSPPVAAEQDGYSTPPKKERRVSIEVSKENGGSPEQTPRSILDAFPDSPESEQRDLSFPEGAATPSDKKDNAPELGGVSGDEQANAQGGLKVEEVAPEGGDEGEKLSDHMELEGQNELVKGGGENVAIEQESVEADAMQGGEMESNGDLEKNGQGGTVEKRTKVTPSAKRQLSLHDWVGNGGKKGDEGPVSGKGQEASVQLGEEELDPPTVVGNLEEENLEEQVVEREGHEDSPNYSTANESAPTFATPAKALQSPTAPNSQSSGDHSNLDLASNKASGTRTPEPLSETHSLDGFASEFETHPNSSESAHVFPQGLAGSEQASDSADDFVLVDSANPTEPLPSPEPQTDANQHELAKPTNAIAPPSKREIEEILSELPEGGSVPVVVVPPEAENVAAAAQVLCSWCGHDLGDADDDDLALCCMLALQKLQDARKLAQEKKVGGANELPVSDIGSRGSFVSAGKNASMGTFLTASESLGGGLESAEKGKGGNAVNSDVMNGGKRKMESSVNGKVEVKGQNKDGLVGGEELGSSKTTKRRKAEEATRKEPEGTWAAKVRWWLDGMSN